MDNDTSGRSRLISNVLTSWMSNFLIIITGFFMPRVIDEQLGQATVGIWDFAWSLVAYVNMAQLGIGSSLNRFISTFKAEGAPEKITTAASTVSAIQALLSAVVLALVLLVFFTLPHYYEFGDDVRTAQYTVLFIGLSITSQFFFDTSRGVLTGSHRWDIYNGLYSGIQVSASLVMIVAMLLGYGLITIAATYFVFVFTEGLIRSRIAVRICPEARFSRNHVSLDFAGNIVRFGIKAFVLGIAPIVVIQGTNLLIAASLGPVMLAVFARPNALIRQMQTIVTRFTFILTPMAGPILKKEGIDSIRAFTIECARYGLAIALPMVIVFCFYGDDIITLWMGPDYVNSTLVLTLGLGFLLPFAQSPITRVMIGLDYHGLPARIAIVLNTVLFAIGAYTIAQLGERIEYYALMIAVIISFTHGLLIPAYACYRLGLNFLRYCLASFLEVSLIGLLGLALLYALQEVLGLTGLWGFFNTGIYLSLTAVLYWYRVLTPEVRERVVTGIRERLPF